MEDLIEELFGTIEAVGVSYGGPDDGRLTYMIEYPEIGHTFTLGKWLYIFEGEVNNRQQLVYRGVCNP